MRCATYQIQTDTEKCRFAYITILPFLHSKFCFQKVQRHKMSKMCKKKTKLTSCTFVCRAPSDPMKKHLPCWLFAREETQSMQGRQTMKNKFTRLEKSIMYRHKGRCKERKKNLEGTAASKIIIKHGVDSSHVSTIGRTRAYIRHRRSWIDKKYKSSAPQHEKQRSTGHTDVNISLINNVNWIDSQCAIDPALERCRS